MCKAWENSMAQAKNDGLSQGKIEAVLSVAKKFSLSIEEAMDAVGIQKSEWDTYAPMVEKRLKANTL